MSLWSWTKLNNAFSAILQATFLNAWATLSQLQYSVVQKRIQLEKERLQLKLNKVLHSQVSRFSTNAQLIQ